jgi:hypothetical protein
MATERIVSDEVNRGVRAEIDSLVQQKILTPGEARQIAERYPTTPWDVLVLVRWFTILGAVTTGAGAVILAKAYVNALRLAEAGLAVAMLAFIYFGRYAAQTKGFVKTGAALEMVGGFALQGLIFVLAIDFSTGSKNWPALVGIQALLLAVLAYALKNRLVLIHASVCFFTFFGGETGYMSGWGAYWLSMTYPVRFLAIGFVFLGVAWVHATALRGAYQAFSRVYFHLGLLTIHFALWFLALFGYFENSVVSWEGTDGQRAAFSAAWAAVSLVSIWLSGTIGQRILRSYGLTFLVIDVYTFYFQFIVARSAQAWWLHLILVGGSLVWLGVAIERQLRTPPDSSARAAGSS